MASLQRPKYRVVLKKRNENKKYILTNAAIEITLTDAEEGFAYQAEVKFANIKVGEDRLSSLTAIRDTLYVYVNTSKDESSENNVLLFFGPVWQKNVLTEKERTFTLMAYDSLIYLQKSEGKKFFKKGKKTKTILKTICKSWGLKLSYSYSSVKHGKKRLNGDYASFIVNLLERVRRKTGVKGILRNNKGKIQVIPEGHNKSYYTIKNGETIISNEYVATMEDVVTKVIAIGAKKKKGKNKKKKAIVKGDTKEWGTIQKILDMGDKKLSTAKKEAKQMIKDNGKPQKRRKITAYDIPFVRKGDQIMVNSEMSIVKTITHNLHERTMELEVEKKK